MQRGVVRRVGVGGGGVGVCDELSLLLSVIM